MKKILFSAILLVTMILTACGSNRESLVGSWKIQDDRVEYNEVFTFNEDGTGKYYIYLKDELVGIFDFTYYYDEQENKYIWCCYDGSEYIKEPIQFVSKKEIMLNGKKGPIHLDKIE